MKLVRISHWRCDEPSDAYTLAWAPDDWGEDAIHDALDRAQREYLGAYKQLVDGLPAAPNDYRPHQQPPYANYPDKTVAAIQAEWKEKRVVYEAWQKETRRPILPFASFLEAQGLDLNFWDERPEIMQVTCSWGHRHGQKMGYEDTPLDTWPSPAKLFDAISRASR